MRYSLIKFLLALVSLVFVSCSEINIVDAEASASCLERTVYDVDVPSNVVFIGNSLLFGNGTFGLSASDSTKDYFAHVDSAFRRLNPDYVNTRIMAKNIEKTLSDQKVRDALSTVVEPYISDSADLVIIQLGDNFSTRKEIEGMSTTVANIYESVCRSAPHARVVWVGEWYSTDAKQKALKKMAEKNNAEFIDISDIYSKSHQGKIGDVTTYPDYRKQTIKYTKYSVSGDSLTISFKKGDNSYKSTVVVTSYNDNPEKHEIEIYGFQTIVDSKGKATHPNDEGFRLIAERILEGLGYGN